MQTFLDTVAADLFGRYGEKISDLCLVFPNRRARLFFGESLSRIIEKPLWQPTYKSIEELVFETSSLQPADTFSLLVELYEIYCATRKTDETFDRFYYWGETLLHDFDQIDKYCVNAAALFSNLRDYKAFDGDFSFLTPEQIAYIQKFWSNFLAEKESRLQQDFIEIWNILLPIYQQFRTKLKEKNIAYDGMIYRDMVESLADEKTKNLFAGHYIFIGFNALNECERKLFRFLQTRKQADFYWDYDNYYVNDEQQEAGLFLRKNIENFPSPESYNHDFSSFSKAKDITAIASPSAVAQVKIVPQLLEDMPATKAEKTAIVLADEQLLIPLLHSLPDSIGEINVTMGYPLRQTAIFSLLEILLQLFVNAKQKEKGETKYYYKDILALLSHPYIKQLNSSENAKIYNNFVSLNTIYVSNQFFADNQLFHELLLPIENFGDLNNRLLFLLDNLSLNESLNNADTLLQGNIQFIVCKLNKFYDALAKSRIEEISIKLYAKLLRNIFQRQTIPFTGEPLMGVQVLGMLETRNIDFDNLIILSVNEGILPQLSRHVSFIPYNLRHGFGLPVPEQQEAIWAYYFYRLLQRANRVKIIYNTKNEGVKNGEASRYLLQLKLESGHQVKEENLSFDIEFPEEKAIQMEKAPEVLQLLVNNYCGKEAVKKFSPSALNAYLACPLKFYFKYVEHIYELDEIEEKIDNRIFGNLLHKAMEIIYAPWIGKEISGSVFDKLLANPKEIEKVVQQSIAEEYYQKPSLPPDFKENGDILIVHDILCQYVKQLLLVDKKQAPFVPEGLEYLTQHYFSFSVNEKMQEISFGGIIDRLHRKGNNWFVVDYKTGATQNEFSTIEELFGNEEKKQQPAILQTLLYSLIIYAEKKQPVTPLLYLLRESYDESVDFGIRNKETKEKVNDIAVYAEELTELLSEKLSELFNPSIPFTQTTDKKTCEYCDYKAICRK